MLIIRNGEQASAPGPDAWFTGSVRIDPLFPKQENTVASGAIVTFEPGARTAWHTHPAGQTLIILSGLGWIQKAGSAIETVQPGDVVYFAPGEKHWHGASLTKAMSHIAIQEEVGGAVVTWMEKVTEEQYTH
ncbi:MAG: cupin domain-containing protein [Saprospiraceae bacterium]|nr:cupin domain-containing protein [Saprospiraceae bacterium]